MNKFEILQQYGESAPSDSGNQVYRCLRLSSAEFNTWIIDYGHPLVFKLRIEDKTHWNEIIVGYKCFDDIDVFLNALKNYRTTPQYINTQRTKY